MLVAWLVLPVLLTLVCAGCGLAVARATGVALPRPLVLPVGFATVIVVASAATASNATAELATPAVLALAVTGFLVARDRLGWLPGRWPAAAAAGVYLVFGAPVLASGAAVFTGYIQLDDIATWLALTDLAMERGRDFSGLPASSFEATTRSYLPQGYPIGAFLPLGLGGELTLGTDIARLFTPTMAFTAALLALTLDALVTPLLLRPRVRAAVTFLAAQPALLWAYVEWGAMKEVVAALLVALIAALAPTLGDGPRRVLPLALAISALVAALSLGGGVWVAPVVLVAVAASRLRLRALVTSVPVLLGAFVLTAIPSLVLAKDFLTPQLKEGSVLTAATELGNLIEPLPASHLLGIWPAGDFRVTPDQQGLTTFLLVLLALAAAGGFAFALQRRAGGLVGYAAGGLAGCALLVSRGSPWVDGKSMATAAPIILLLGLTALARVAFERRDGVASALAAAAFTALAAGVLWSNVLGYGTAYVAPAGQVAELEAAGKRLSGQGPTLMTEYEPYGARHFLRKAEGEGASELRDRLIPLRNGEQLGKSASADVTAFDPTALREYRSLMLRTSPLTSRPPSDYRRIRAGQSYDLWQRGPARPDAPVDDLPLGSPADPAAVPQCSAVRELAAQVAPEGTLVAVERATPVVLSLGGAELTGGVEPSPNDPASAVPKDDGGVRADVTVPRDGTYGVWLGGSTRGTTTVRIDGRETGSVRGRLNNQGGTMRFGRVRLTQGPHRIELSYADGGLAPGQRGQDALGLPFGPLVLAPREPPLEPFSVPATQASKLCGRHLDWIEAHAG